MSNIITAFNLLENISMVQSTSHKEALLKANKDHEILKSLLIACYDPFTVYNIKKIDGLDYADRHNPMTPEANYRSFMTLLDRLSSRIVTGNAAIYECQKFFSYCSEQEAIWYTRVLKKDLNIGIKVKTINKCIPGLITVFEVMLAKELDRYPDLIILEPKLDGLRGFGNTTTGELFSRNGKLLEGFDSVSADLKKFGPGYWVDGELLSGSKYNTTMTQAFRHSQGKEAGLNSFDIITHEDFARGHSSLDQIERKQLLTSMLEDIQPEAIVRVIHSEVIDTKDPFFREKVNDYYERCLAAGYEGIMVKDATAQYECKRGHVWQKMKPVKTYDIKVKSLEAGKPDTKYAECLGKLVCDFNGNEVRVGSGISDAQRQEWWNNPLLIVGKTIEVLAQEETENQHGTSSLRFPRFKQIRWDK